MWITQGHKQVCSLACFPANLLFQLHVNQPKQGCWACTFLVTTCETAICLDAFVHLSNASNVPHADAGERISRVSSSPGMDASCRSGGEYRAKQRDAKQADDKLADEESDGLVMCSLLQGCMGIPLAPWAGGPHLGAVPTPTPLPVSPGESFFASKSSFGTDYYFSLRGAVVGRSTPPHASQCRYLTVNLLAGAGGQLADLTIP